MNNENILNLNPCLYEELDNSNKSKLQLSKDYHNFFIKRENSFIINLFYMQQINSFICKCGSISYCFEKYLDIPILISNDHNHHL